MFHITIYIIFMIKLGACSEASLNGYDGMSLATSELEPLVETYKTIIDLVEEYVLMEEKRLLVIKRYIHDYNIEPEVAKNDAFNYIKNPLQAFSIIKKLTTELDEVKESIRTGTGNNENVTSLLDLQDEKLPTLGDVEQAAMAMKGLKEAYRLDVKELADGNINGVTYSLPMLADDCYLLSKVYYYYDHYSDAEPWILEAIKKLKLEEQDDLQYKDKDSWITLLGNIQQGLRYELMEKMSETYADEESATSVNLKQHMDSLCRDELQISHSITRTLTCSVMSNRPLLRLAPIKTEQLYIDPDVFLFHDVINDEEIDLFKKLAKPKLKRAEVTFGTSKLRTGKGAWLENKDFEILSQRVASFTGLSMDLAEHYHIVNYGIGGYYTPHFDHFTSLSDVEQGGATVFPELNLSVFPIKNAALFWFNLFPSGVVATKWIRQDSQVFTRPCDLEDDELDGTYPWDEPEDAE